MTFENDHVSFKVNGKQYNVNEDKNTPLLFVLREYLGLSATRFGCGEGTCGACTVIINDEAILSCDVPVGEIEGKSVETAEGLQREPNDPLFRAFIKNQAGQCGYCLSGILMASKALLRKDPLVSRAKIAKALDGNLCRCGAHKRILDAIEEAAKSVVDNA